MKQITMDKTYTTKGGQPVRLLCVDAEDEAYYPVVGLVSGSPRTWTLDGVNMRSSTHTDGDLIEVKPRIKRTVWLTVYEVGTVAREANQMPGSHTISSDKRIACIKVDIDCEYGEGLGYE